MFRLPEQLSIWARSNTALPFIRKSRCSPWAVALTCVHLWPVGLIFPEKPLNSDLRADMKKPLPPCEETVLVWWPGTESNHRHADVQSHIPSKFFAYDRPGRPTALSAPHWNIRGVSFEIPSEPQRQNLTKPAWKHNNSSKACLTCPL